MNMIKFVMQEETGPLDCRIDGKRALVTGAGRGIGAAIAHSLAAAGATVVVNDIVAERADAVAAAIGRQYGGAVAIQADTADPQQAAILFERAVAEIGGLDVLVCNAGITLPKTISETTLDEWELVLRTNLTGSFLCAQRAFEIMQRQGSGGRIVFIGSVTGQQGALQGHVAYGASKAGVHGLAKTLARTVAPLGITVNVIAPGPIETEMLRGAHSAAVLAKIANTMPLGLGSVDDVAAAAVFLASEAARHLTGTTLDLNGGMHMR